MLAHVSAHQDSTWHPATAFSIDRKTVIADNSVSGTRLSWFCTWARWQWQVTLASCLWVCLCRWHNSIFDSSMAWIMLHPNKWWQSAFDNGDGPLSPWEALGSRPWKTWKVGWLWTGATRWVPVFHQSLWCPRKGLEDPFLTVKEALEKSRNSSNGDDYYRGGSW